MQEEPTSLRIDDPGVRALFTESARFQSWLDVEAALAQAQAELGIIPDGAAREITRKAHLSYLDLEAVRAGLARTGHPLVPLVWELDRACEGDAGGYVHWGRPPRTSPRPASSSRCGAPMTSSCASSRSS
jgi:3-carboxy-cis,cis-muconate cycloisomerase